MARQLSAFEARAPCAQPADVLSRQTELHALSLRVQTLAGANANASGNANGNGSSSVNGNGGLSIDAVRELNDAIARLPSSSSLVALHAQHTAEVARLGTVVQRAQRDLVEQLKAIHARAAAAKQRQAESGTRTRGRGESHHDHSLQRVL